MELLQTIASTRSNLLTGIFSLITKLGEELIAILILSAIFWCMNKKAAYCIGISYFLSGILVQALKITFRIDRPWIKDSSFIPVASAMEHATGYSFPSGHTQSATALFGTMGLSLKKGWQKIICFILVLLVGFSRLYLGVHTLLDVSVSMLISFVIAVLMVSFYDKMKIESNTLLPLVLVIISISVVVLASLLFSSSLIEQSYVIDCLKAGGAAIGFAIGMYIEKRFINFSVKSKNLWMQILKYIFGIIGVLVIKEGLKLIIGTGPVVDTIRYILIGLWISGIFPIIIRKVFEIKEEQE